jgi:lipoprotein
MKKIFSLLVVLLMIISCSKEDSKEKKVDNYLRHTWSGRISVMDLSSGTDYMQECSVIVKNKRVNVTIHNSTPLVYDYEIIDKKYYGTAINIESGDENEGVNLSLFFNCTYSSGFDYIGTEDYFADCGHGDGELAYARVRIRSMGTNQIALQGVLYSNN